MMKKTQVKETVRTIRRNFMSWLAVAVVTMIGCGVYCGAFFYGDALEASGETFYNECRFEDLDILTPQGISEEAIEGLLTVDGIADAEGTYEFPESRVILGDDEIEAVIMGDTKRIGISPLVSGTYPVKEDECALTSDTMETYGISLGDEIEAVLPSAAPEGFLKSEKLRVTAEVMNPRDFQRGGSAYVILPEAAFDREKLSGYYTNVRVKAELPEGISSISEEYDDRIQEIRLRLDEHLDELSKTEGEKRRAEAEADLQERREAVDAELDEAEKTLSEKEQELSEGEKAILDAEKEMEGGDSALKDAEEQIAEGKAEIESAEKQLASAKRQLSNARAELDQREAMLTAEEGVLGAPIPEADAEIRNARSTLAKKSAELKEKEAQLNEKKAELAEAEEAFAEKKKQYEEAKENLPAKKQELLEGKAKLAEAKEEFRQKKEEAGKQLEEAERFVESLSEMFFAVTTREEDAGYLLHRQFVEVLRNMSTIFVVIFLVIGVVVVLSTITILVDNQKKLIGAMKAFGFRNGEIISKFCVFGFSGVALGMGLSVVLAFSLERIIHTALKGFFCVEASSFTFRLPVFLLLFLIEGLLAIVTAAVSTWHNAVRSSAVDLMNGVSSSRNPRRGVKVKIKGSLYSHLILRNIRRDWVRVMCSVIVIGGSCLMMGVGFTLNDSFEKMMPLSAAEVKHFQLEVSASPGYEEELIGAAKKLREDGVSFEEITGRNGMYRFRDTEEYGRVVTAPPEVFSDFLELKDFYGIEIFRDDGGGVLIPSKLSERLHIKQGDEISLYDSNMSPHTFPVDGVYKSYIGRELYLSRENYKALFGEVQDPTMLLVRTEDRKGLSAELSVLFPNLVIDDTSVLPESLTGMRKLFRTLVLVMTSLSVMMSIFVLLNLVNIFVGRRKNEIIIMGVNGFSVRERIGYLLRETIVTTVLGLILGVLGGFLLTDTLVLAVEGTDTMFRRGFDPMAWVLGCGLEAVFALLINFFAFRRVRKYELTELTR